MPTRPPLRNNARLILILVVALLGVLLGVQLLVRESGDFAPDFLASVLLYGLTVLNLTLFLVLLLVLGRNIAKALMERRRGVLGARFRLRLLIVFTAMALGPAQIGRAHV
jgi:two-component system nitrogen regulation sensor histidine kinase NtrY